MEGRPTAVWARQDRATEDWATEEWATGVQAGDWLPVLDWALEPVQLVVPLLGLIGKEAAPARYSV